MKTFPCLYNKEKLNNDDSASAFCIDKVGFCDVITLPEHTQLVDYGKYLEDLLPLWIVLIVLGVVGACVLPLRIARVGRHICDCVEPIEANTSRA